MKNMANSPITGEAVRRAGAAGLRERCGIYLQTGVIDPLFSGVVVLVATTGLSGISNAIHYLKKKKSGKEAVSDTFKESGKVGLCSVIGIVAGNGVAGTGLVLIAPSVLPIAAGVTATFLLKRLLENTISGAKNVVPVTASEIYE